MTGTVVWNEKNRGLGRSQMLGNGPWLWRSRFIFSFSESLHGPNIESQPGLLQWISTTLYFSEYQPGPFIESSPGLLQCFSESQPYFFNDLYLGLHWIFTCTSSVNPNHTFSNMNLYLDPPLTLHLACANESLFSTTLLQQIATRTASVNLYLDCFSASLPGLLLCISTWTASVHLYRDCFCASLPGLLLRISTWTASVHLYLDCFCASLPGLLLCISTWTASVHLYLDCFNKYQPTLL